MLQKILLILCLLYVSPSFGQYKICKEYYTSKDDSFHRKRLSSISYYDTHQNIIRKVSFSWDGIVFDTTDYAYSNSLLIKEARYWKVDPVSRPVDSVLNYIKKHPEALGHSLQSIVKLQPSDTEMTRYYYDTRGLLVKKEYAMFRDIDQSREHHSVKRKLEDIHVTYTPVSRAWHDQRVTNYIYGNNNKLIEANGDLYDKAFGEYSVYVSSARKFFYNSKNQVVLDSIVSYNGAAFDGAISTYTYFSNGYNVRRVEYEATGLQYSMLIFTLNSERKILEEVIYDLKLAESPIDDSKNLPREKHLYEYDGTGRLIKKETFYNNLNPTSITYYTYE